MENIREAFKKYIMNLQIPENLPIDKEQKLVSELYSYCWRITPSKLFKYRNCNQNSINAFKNDQLFLSKPTIFNDPHDSLLYIDKEKILNILSTNTSEKHFEKTDRLLLDKNFKNAEIKKFGKAFIDRIIENSTYKGKPIKLSPKLMDSINVLQKNQIVLITDLAKKSIKQASLISCFSELIDSTLMWAHYSNNHTGFALEYDLKSMYDIDIGKKNIRGSLFVDNKLFPVIYSDKRYNATDYVEFNFIENFYHQMGLKFHEPFYDKLFYYKSILFKSNEWEYEKEWRLIRLTDNDIENPKPDYSYLPNIRAKCLYIGSEISESNSKILIDIATIKKMKVYKMIVDDDQEQYSLSFNEIKIL